MYFAIGVSSQIYVYRPLLCEHALLCEHDDNPMISFNAYVYSVVKLMTQIPSYSATLCLKFMAKIHMP